MDALESLNEHTTIESYIQELSELKIPVKVVIDEKIVFTGCRLVYDTDQTKGLFIQTKQGDYPETGEVSLTCALLKTLYTFKSRIISRKEIDPKYTYLEIQFPKTITRQERRKYFRIRPSEENPVRIRFSLADNRIINAEAMDISGGGISFVVPENMSHFQIGDPLSLNVTLPTFGEVHFFATVRYITRLFNIARIGVEFTALTEAAQRVVIQYVIAREVEMRKESDSTAPLRRARICLIGNSRRCEEYKFLDSRFDVVKTDFFDVISKLTANPPELITLSHGLRESATLLQLIRKNRVLKHIPLILVNREEEDEGSMRENVAILSTPFHEKLFVRTAEDLIEKYRLVRRIREEIDDNSRTNKSAH